MCSRARGRLTPANNCLVIFEVYILRYPKLNLKELNMQSLPLSPLDLARSLLSEIEAHANAEHLQDARGEFTRWTLAVKGWLSRKGEQFGLASIYTDGQGTSEFMLDFVWWKNGPGGGAVLACEMEWGNTRDPRRNPGRVAEDFAKLLSFKAPLKLMIFSSYDDTNIQTQTITELNRYLSEFDDHRVGEKYVVLDLSREQAAWLCDITDEGYAVDLHLEKIPVTSDRP